MSRPFDPTTASLYGQFVQAAYSMYNADPTNLTPAQSDDFPDGYRLVAWIQMQDFILESTGPLFYGLVAQNESAADQFVVAIRGTSNGVEWWDDLNAINKVPFKVLGCGKVGEGFARIYDTLEVIESSSSSPTAVPAALRSLRPAGAFAQQVSALVRRHAPARLPARGSARGTARSSALPPSASVEVTGHSLGAALATLYTMENAHTEQLTNPMICTFASPLVGDTVFVSVFNDLGLTSWRVDNAPDFVTKVPPAILGFAHVDTEVPVNSAGRVAPSPGCWHSLATYLSLIDPSKQPSADCLPTSVALPAARPTRFTGTRRKIARYGWKPDLPDQRDYSYAVPPGVLQAISGREDLRPRCPPVYDQGQIGSCTANAIAAALEFDMMKQGLPSFTPSRLFIYYNERSMEGTVGSDAGAFIRDGIKSVANQGDCPETEWTYDGAPADQPSNVFPAGAKAATAPSPQCYQDAIRHKALTYQSVDQNLADMKGCLSSGYPFVFGFTVYPSFESDEVARTGIVPMPASNESTVGGHAVLAVGYDDDEGHFIVRNSWGNRWGLAGYCYMPYAYLLDNNLSSDFWTIRVVT